MSPESPLAATTLSSRGVGAHPALESPLRDGDIGVSASPSAEDVPESNDVFIVMLVTPREAAKESEEQQRDKAVPESPV